MTKRPRFLIEVPEQGLCHGCGGCGGACPTDAITMKPTPKGTLAPDIELDKCTHCGLCFSVCPGHSFDVPYFHKEIYAFFGRHCKGIYSTHFFDFLLKRYGLTTADVKSFNLRSKEWPGWPADLCIETHDGRTIDLSGGLSRTGPRDYFAQMRSLTCTDKLNEFSDVSFGDCRVPWVYDKQTLAQAEGDNNPDQSDIVARTERGSALIQSAINRALLITKKMDWTDLVASTKPSEKKLAISILKLLAPVLGFSIPEYGVRFRPKDARDRRSLNLLHIPTFASSAFFATFWKVAKFPLVRAFYDKLPLRYMHLVGGVRRRLPTYRRATTAEIEAIYREVGEMKILPGTYQPLVRKNKTRSNSGEKQRSFIAVFNE